MRSDRLATELERCVRQERRRLAQDLHDGVAQDLFVARQELAEALDGRPDSLPRLGRALDSALGHLRQQIADLHRPSSREEGEEEGDLKAQIARLAAQMERLGHFSCSVRVAPEALGSRDELVLAISRELLINVVQHAGATRASVGVTRVGHRLVVEVADDGCGIEPGRRGVALATGHIGLASLIERVRAVGGETTIVSAPGAGTTVRVELPLQ